MTKVSKDLRVKELTLRVWLKNEAKLPYILGYKSRLFTFLGQ